MLNKPQQLEQMYLKEKSMGHKPTYQPNRPTHWKAAHSLWSNS